jgi:hypothetical protein
MCDFLHNACGVKQSEDDSVFLKCKALAESFGPKTVKDGKKADIWNAAVSRLALTS